MNKFFILFLLLIPLISALQITEVETNPYGTDSGQEWIEFYSEIEVNLSEYKIMNNDQGEFSLSGNNSGYFILILDSQWLDNSDEKVYLYKGSELIQETILFEDSKNDELTFQLCEDKWVFKEGTQNSENNCESKVEPDPEPEAKNITPEIPPKPPAEQVKSFPKSPKQEAKINDASPIKQGTIHLNTQTIKTPENFPKQDRKPIIFFIGFCIALAILYFIQAKGKNKNEFR